VLAAIETYRVTHSQWVPTMFIRMLKLPAGIRAKRDLSSLRTTTAPGPSTSAPTCPCHPTGKLFKRVLRDEYTGGQETPP
jgi:acyl-CoA synthetase (AMP-forming)/AMP-acid ligase II